MGSTRVTTSGAREARRSRMSGDPLQVRGNRFVNLCFGDPEVGAWEGAAASACTSSRGVWADPEGTASFL